MFSFCYFIFKNVWQYDVKKNNIKYRRKNRWTIFKSNVMPDNRPVDSAVDVFTSYSSAQTPIWNALIHGLSALHSERGIGNRRDSQAICG